MKRAAALLFVVGCATIGSESDVPELPTSGVGPFRKFEAKEVRGIAPFVLDDSRVEYLEPSVLPDGGGVILYATKRTATSAGEIVRTRADDNRTFYGATGHFGKTPATVLTPSLPWEGTALGRPAALRVGGEIWVYYAASGGIGLAKSGNGLAFRKEPQPVLGPATGTTWETEPPREPTVALFPDGKFHMLYVSGAAIGEATSPDGIHFTRSAGNAILGANPKPGTVDHGAVGCPTLLPRITPGDRLHVRVLYTAFDRPRTDTAAVSVLSFAARYESEGPLTVNELPVLALRNGERCPSLYAPAAASAEYRLLYFDMKQPGQTTHGIAAAIAPVAAKLGEVGDFPASP